MRNDLTIGRLAERTGVNVETIRYYQRRGLLDEPKKPLGGYRHYPPDTAKRVRFIKRAQALGFTLEEIVGLLRLEAASACAETRELAAHKLTLINEKLAELTAMRKGLTALVSECGKGGKHPCPIIQMLVTDDVSCNCPARSLEGRQNHDIDNKGHRSRRQTVQVCTRL